MTDTQLCKVWTTTGLFLLALSLDSWLRTQGLEPMFGSKLPHDDRTASALLGFIFTGAGMGLLLRIAFFYTSRQQTGSLSSRLPIAFFATLDTSKKESIFYQRTFYLLFNTLPLMAMFHFYKLVIDSKYFVNDGCVKLKSPAFSVWEWPQGDYIWNNGYRLNNCDGLTFFPLLEPILMTLVGLLIIAISVRYFLTLIGRERLRPFTKNFNSSKDE